MNSKVILWYVIFFHYNCFLQFLKASSLHRALQSLLGRIVTFVCISWSFWSLLCWSMPNPAATALWWLYFSNGFDGRQIGITSSGYGRIGRRFSFNTAMSWPIIAPFFILNDSWISKLSTFIGLFRSLPRWTLILPGGRVAGIQCPAVSMLSGSKKEPVQTLACVEFIRSWSHTIHGYLFVSATSPCAIWASMSDFLALPQVQESKRSNNL